MRLPYVSPSRANLPIFSGGDFHIATDGNFHHRHLISAGESIAFHSPKHIIPKSFVDGVGDSIFHARRSPSKPWRARVPDAAVDECEKSYEAADGDKKKPGSGSGLRYDDMGWMSLVCRHDIPLFFANIDTPGEQQKYAVALILWLFNHIPPQATVTVLYDIGCVLDRSIHKVGHPYRWTIVCILTSAPTVRHTPTSHHAPNSIRYNGNACVRASVVMPAHIQP